VLLKHLGQNNQAIEYLDFIQEDPPNVEGIGNTQTIAFATLSYEQSGPIFSAACERSYSLLQETYIEDLGKGQKPEITKRKVDKLFSTHRIEEMSEIWENVGLQMIERCEYVAAFEFLKQVLDS
jgi:hypothetical protein